MPIQHLVRLAAAAAVSAAAAVALAPAVFGTSSSTTHLRGGIVDTDPGVLGPDGSPVVERHISSDMVIDWLETPPAEATEWLHEVAAPADHGAAAGHGHHHHHHGHHHHDHDDHHDHDGDVELTAHWQAASASGAHETVDPGQGFEVFSASARLLRGGYTIRLAGADSRIEQLRPELEAAARAASAASGIPVRVAPGRGGPVDPARGEIVALVGQGPCGPAALGCGGPTLTSTELVAGRVWLSSAALGRSSADRMNLASHELGHALGLRHHTGGWVDGRQVMYPTVFGLPSYRAGDGRGLKFMAGGYDRPAGQITDRRYAAGNVHVTGTLSSGTRVRVSVGPRSTDVTASGGRFTAAVPAGPGTHRVCTTSLDAAPGFHRGLGCADVHAPGAPFGRLEAVGSSFETVHVGGWAIDPQTADPIDVEIRRNGTLIATETADVSRPDVEAAHRRYGPHHGYSLQVPAVAGRNEICVRALGVGGGGNTDLGCASATHAIQPVGAFEAISVAELGATVTGWALDPNTPEPIWVRVTVDGSLPATPSTFQARDDRPDVERRHPAHGPAHGFSQRLVLEPGAREVCLTAVNVGLGTDQPLGCRRVEVPPPLEAVPSLAHRVVADVTSVLADPSSVTAVTEAVIDEVLTAVPVLGR